MGGQYLVYFDALEVGVGGDEGTFEVVAHISQEDVFHFAVEGVVGGIVAFRKSFAEAAELWFVMFRV